MTVMTDVLVTLDFYCSFACFCTTGLQSAESHFKTFPQAVSKSAYSAAQFVADSNKMLAPQHVLSKE